MRIAQIAPLYESVPPRLYGGTERVVSYLTEELVRQGHEVTLFASGDSVTSARLIPCCSRALRLSKCQDPFAFHVLMLERVFQNGRHFDIHHFHIDYMHYPFSRRSLTANVTTLHGRLDLPELRHLYSEFRDVPVVSISDAQRTPLRWLNWQATVHHGLPAGLHTFREKQGKYLVFLGRISPEKRVDLAIQIAIRAGMELKIAAKVDSADREYFETEIRPLLGHPLIEFIGEVGDAEKDELLGNAYALLFPIDWPEPFGLVMIEALACGTPVIACRRGSVQEILDDGVTGFIVDKPLDAVQAIERVARLNRRACRETFERRFSAERMAAQYLETYRAVITGRRLQVPAA
ncbi:MAG: glycosyltransferase family 4 protein [Rhodospirillales bacterium]